MRNYRDNAEVSGLSSGDDIQYVDDSPIPNTHKKTMCDGGLLTPAKLLIALGVACLGMRSISAFAASLTLRAVQ